MQKSHFFPSYVHEKIPTLFPGYVQNIYSIPELRAADIIVTFILSELRRGELNCIFPGLTIAHAVVVALSQDVVLLVLVLNMNQLAMSCTLQL